MFHPLAQPCLPFWPTPSSFTIFQGLVSWKMHLLSHLIYSFTHYWGQACVIWLTVLCGTGILNTITGKIKEGDATSGQVYITCLTVSMYCESAPPSKRQDHGHDADITEMESCLLSSAQLRITVRTRLQVNTMTCPPQRYWLQWWGPKLVCSCAMVAKFSSYLDGNAEPLRFLWDAVPRPFSSSLPIFSVDLSASNKVVKHIGIRVGKTWTQHCILSSSSLVIVTKLDCTCLLSIKWV